MINDSQPNFLDNTSSEEILIRVPVAFCHAEVSRTSTPPKRLSAIAEIISIVFLVLFLTWLFTPTRGDLWKTLTLTLPIAITIVHLAFSVVSHALRSQ